MVQARQGEGLPRSCRLQVDPAKQEVQLFGEEQGSDRFVRCARIMVSGRFRGRPQKTFTDAAQN